MIGEYVHAHADVVREHSFEALIRRIRKRPDLATLVQALPHQAAPLLEHYRFPS